MEDDDIERTHVDVMLAQTMCARMRSGAVKCLLLPTPRVVPAAQPWMQEHLLCVWRLLALPLEDHLAETTDAERMLTHPIVDLNASAAATDAHTAAQHQMRSDMARAAHDHLPDAVRARARAWLEDTFCRARGMEGAYHQGFDDIAIRLAARSLTCDVTGACCLDTKVCDAHSGGLRLFRRIVECLSLPHISLGKNAESSTRVIQRIFDAVQQQVSALDPELSAHLENVLRLEASLYILAPCIRLLLHSGLSERHEDWAWTVLFALNPCRHPHRALAFLRSFIATGIVRLRTHLLACPNYEMAYGEVFALSGTNVRWFDLALRRGASLPPEDADAQMHTWLTDALLLTYQYPWSE